MIERLEPRQHLSATLAGNVLTIVGTDRADDIAIAAGKREIVVHDNGRQTPFDARAIKTIRIQGLRGDDSIIVSPKLPIRASIEAGPGNDRIGGGAGNDTIFGDRGSDTLVGNAGHDYLDAGPDDDLIEDYTGINVIHGGAGNDSATVDAERLSTGIETMRRIGSGRGIGEIEVRKESGTLILRYFGYLGSINDTAVQAGPVLRSDGSHEITSSFTFDSVGSGIVDEYDHRWDITDQISDGIIFIKTFAEAFEANPSVPQTIFSLPLFLPSK